MKNGTRGRRRDDGEREILDPERAITDGSYRRTNLVSWPESRSGGWMQ